MALIYVFKAFWQKINTVAQELNHGTNKPRYPQPQDFQMTGASTKPYVVVTH